MMTGKYIFQGNVRVYLEGQNALCPTVTTDQEMHYHIGQENTELIIRDYRAKPILAAQKAISTQYQNGFSNTFNEQAWAEICYEQADEKLEIVLRDPDKKTDARSPLLWLGVLEDNIMPDYDVEWEVFKSLDNGQTAFVSLLPSP
jgi:hypothetical protein